MSTECLLCERDFKNNTDEEYGKGCLTTIFKLFNLRKPRKVKDKEQFLKEAVLEKYSNIKLTNKNESKLFQQLVALKLIESIGKDSLNDIEEVIKEDIYNTANDVNQFVAEDISLNDIYNLYKINNRLESRLRTMQRKKFESFEELSAYARKEFGFVFPKTASQKNKEFYAELQRNFWNVVADVGDKMGFTLSAKLLRKSLSLDSSDLIIDNAEEIDKILHDEAIEKEINKLLSKNKVPLRVQNVQGVIFKSKDLYFALHNVNLEEIAVFYNKDSQKMLKVKISDMYNFDSIKTGRNMLEGSNNIYTSIAGNTLNNFAYMSVANGVLCEFNILMDVEVPIKLVEE